MTSHVDLSTIDVAAWTRERIRAAAVRAGIVKARADGAFALVAAGRTAEQLTPDDWAAIAAQLGLTDQGGIR